MNRPIPFTTENVFWETKSRCHIKTFITKNKHFVTTNFFACWPSGAPCQPGALRTSVLCLPVNAALLLTLTLSYNFNFQSPLRYGHAYKGQFSWFRSWSEKKRTKKRKDTGRTRQIAVLCLLTYAADKKCDMLCTRAAD